MKLSAYKKAAIERLTYMSGPAVALILVSGFTMVVMLVCVTANAALSYGAGAEHGSKFKGLNLAMARTFSPPVLTDQCLPLLKSVSTKSVTGPHQRPAGTAAALGLLLGVHYALLPPPQDRKSDQALQKLASIDRMNDLNALAPAGSDYQGAAPPDLRSALAVTVWRQCKKEEALRRVLP